MPIDVKKQLDELLALADGKAERLGKHVPKSEDIALVVLKGHLVVEEMLFDIASTHCRDIVELRHARLSFAQLLHVTRALSKFPGHEHLWESIGLLNSLRNALVHNLEPGEVERKIAALDKLCELKGEKLLPNYVKPTEPAHIVAASIHFIIGSLSVLGPVTAFVENNLRLPG